MIGAHWAGGLGVSNTDSFIEEVTEEVRKDRLFALYRRYGWIAALAVLLIVGGATWNEVRKNQAQTRAEALGDAILGALDSADPQQRILSLSQIDAHTGGARAVVSMLTAAEQSEEEQSDAASATLQALAADSDAPEIYRQIASFKALTQAVDMSLDARMMAFEVLAQAGNPLRVLAVEQMALLDIEAGDRASAVARLKALLEDAEVTTGLTRRATALLQALGATSDAG